MAIPNAVQEQERQASEAIEALNKPPAEAPPTDQSASPPPSQPTPDDDPNSETWRSRYETLNGKFNAEVPRLHEQLREVNERSKALEAKVAAAANPPPPPPKLVTEEEIREYSPEYFDMHRRAAREDFMPLLEQRDREIATLQQRLEDSTAQRGR